MSEVTKHRIAPATMTSEPPALPAAFLSRLAILEQSYLGATDPERQSGFSGGAERWRIERSPLLEALPGSGEILDVGCANGYLLECLMLWGASQGLSVTPFGLDCAPALIQLARERLPQYAEHFFVGNAWDWIPPRRFNCVYSLFDCVPREYFGPYVRRLLELFVAPGGRLIVGAYGNRSRGEPPPPIEDWLADLRLQVAGVTSGGSPVMARLAWVDLK